MIKKVIRMVDQLAACGRPVVMLLALMWVYSGHAQPAEKHTDIDGIATGNNAIVAPLAAQSLLQDVVAVQNQLVAVGDRGHILISSGVGNNWQQVADIPTRSMLIAVTVVGNHLWAVGHDAVILHSDDSGQTWQLVHEEPGGDPLLDVIFSAEGEGLAVGAYGLIMRSADWGKSWDTEIMSDLVIADDQQAQDETPQDSLNELGLIDQEAMADYEDTSIQYHLNGLIRINPQTLLVAAEAGRYYISNDDGQSWQQRRLGYEGSMFGVISVSHGNCAVMFGLRGHVFRTCQLGPGSPATDDWQQINIGTNSGLFAAAEDDQGKLWIVGANGAIFSLDEAGTVSDHSVDQGDDFTEVMPLADGLLLLGESGSQFKAFSALTND